MTTFLVIAAGWVLLAGAVAVFMGRRGHATFGWAVVIGALGPFGLPLVVAAVRQERETRPHVIQQGAAMPGPVDVLVGVDGSRASELALDLVWSLFGSRLGRLCLATVIDYDQAELGARSAEIDAQARLDRLANRFPAASPTLAILVGKPAGALADFADEQRFDVIAVGARGEGDSPKVLGSVADHLTRESSVPVLLGGVHERRHAHEQVDVITVAHALGAR